jgi:CheY-specific phosphatase CheX
MSGARLDELLLEVTSQTLEEAAFVFAEPAVALLPWPDEIVEADLSFTGPKTGRLLLATPPELAREIAAGLMGTDIDDPLVQAEGAEAVGEMLNIICGALLEAWFGEEAVCQLGSPEVQVVTKDDFRRRWEGAICSISLVTDEEHRIDAALFG